MEKTLRITGNISALIGIILFLYPLLSVENLKLTTWQIIFISISILITFGYIIYEIFSGPKTYKNSQEIKKYMLNWVSKTGRVVIFTRDMSWVNDDVTKNKLREKAKNSELIICQPRKTPFTVELQNLGAEIYEYPSLNFTPKSRFTFINYNTASSKVAIGRTDQNDVHHIQESSYENIQYFLAEDLINLIKALP